jgi:hypothetical protein
MKMKRRNEIKIVASESQEESRATWFTFHFISLFQCWLLAFTLLGNFIMMHAHTKNTNKLSLTCVD